MFPELQSLRPQINATGFICTVLCRSPALPHSHQNYLPETQNWPLYYLDFKTLMTPQWLSGKATTPQEHIQSPLQVGPQILFSYCLLCWGHTPIYFTPHLGQHRLSSTMWHMVPYSRNDQPNPLCGNPLLVLQDSLPTLFSESQLLEGSTWHWGKQRTHLGIQVSSVYLVVSRWLMLVPGVPDGQTLFKATHH